MAKIPTSKNRIIVIGASAGGLNAITNLLKQLPKKFPAPILIVQHISANASGDVLINNINEVRNVKCLHAVHGHKIKAGYVYLAPSDHHMMVDSQGRLLVTKGAAENRWRPGIDPLFRSAAVAYRNRTIGIILTGYLDDGTSGLQAIKRCGGICIIQDPKDAVYPDMPQNAANQVSVDYSVPISEMGSLLFNLTLSKIPKLTTIPPDIIREAEIAQQILSDLPAVESLGDQVPFNCPGCGGVLWKIKEGFLRYRCHVGHAFTSGALLAEQTKKIEETMWAALRMFEERRNLLTTIAKKGNGASSRSAKERAKASQVHIERIRAILFADDSAAKSDLPR